MNTDNSVLARYDQAPQLRRYPAGDRTKQNRS